MPEPPRPRERLTLAEARRLALAAQGLLRPRPTADAGRRAVAATVARLGLLQIDSVSAVVRSHYLPLFSRLGAYDRTHLDSLAWPATAGRNGRRGLYEYWAHEASLLPLDAHPLLRWRMARAARGQGTYGSLARLAKERPEYVEGVLAQVRDTGPLAAGQLAEPGARGGSWWGWADGKRALEWLFWTGQVSVSTRVGFERRYDLTERVIPAPVLALPTPDEPAAQRALLLQAARAHGVGTAADLADYYRLPITEARARVDELAEEGALVPVAVEGWRDRAYLAPATVVPRSPQGRALLSPFDPLVWARPRTERLFGFSYRLEIYVPAPQRVHGYYVLPFLLDDALVARVDVRSDRAAGVLRVPAAHAEPGRLTPATAGALAEELAALAGWLGLDRVEAAPAGDLAALLSAGARLRGMIRAAGGTSPAGPGRRWPTVRRTLSIDETLVAPSRQCAVAPVPSPVGVRRRLGPLRPERPCVSPSSATTSSSPAPSCFGAGRRTARGRAGTGRGQWSGRPGVGGCAARGGDQRRSQCDAHPQAAQGPDRRRCRPWTTPASRASGRHRDPAGQGDPGHQGRGHRRAQGRQGRSGRRPARRRGGADRPRRDG